MEAAELELFRGAIHRATTTYTGDALDAAVAELGWYDALRVDQPNAVAALFEAQGAANATSSALDHLLGEALGTRPGTKGAIVLPALAGQEPPGRKAVDRYSVRGLGMATLAKAETALVVTPVDDGHVALVCNVGALTCRPVDGLDPELGLLEVTGELQDSDVEARQRVDWLAATAVGQLALGHELVGGARTMLDLAREHALARVQFGRPIASFQAVRHRLAESLVAVEAAAALLAAAWDDRSAVNAAMAKAVAGRSARRVARHAQQVLAGIGFTAEHPLHHFVRRTIVLDQLFGARQALTRRLGAEVLATGALPPPFPL